MELFSQYAVAASAEAIADAGLDLEKEDLTRIGVSVGCGIGRSADFWRRPIQSWWTGDREGFRPF